MITELLFKFLFGIANFIIDLIPEINMSTEFLGMIDQSTFILDSASYFFPMNTLFVCFGVFLLLNNARLVVSLFNFIVRKIPGIS